MQEATETTEKASNAGTGSQGADDQTNTQELHEQEKVRPPSSEEVDQLLRQRVDEAYARLVYALTNEPTNKELGDQAEADMNRAVSAQQSFEKARTARSSAHQQETNPGKKHTLVPQDLPVFQLKDGPVRDKTKKVHESVKAFLNSFEVQLRAHGLSIEENWERLFWLTCDELQRSWFARTLADKGLTWKQVRNHLEKAFGNPYYAWKKRYEARSMRQKKGEQLRLYTERFQEVTFDAGLEDGAELVWNYVSSLVRTVRERAWQVITNHYGLKQPDNLAQVAQLIMTSMGEDTENWADSSDDTSSVEYPSQTNKQKYKSKRTKTHSARGTHSDSHKRFKKGNCRLHLKGSHDEKECELLKSLAAQHTRTTFKTDNTASVTVNLCRYCKKVPYVRGHKCPEYALAQERKAPYQGKPTFKNRSMRIDNTKTLKPAEDHMEVDISQLELQCELKNKAQQVQHKEADFIILHMLFQNEEHNAILDTGANASYIDKSIALLYKLSVNKSSCSHIRVTLASKNTYAPVIGIVENIPIVYGKKSLKYSLYVMELSDEETPISVGTDLMPLLGLGITGLQQQFPEKVGVYKEEEETINDHLQPNRSPVGTPTERDKFMAVIQPHIDANQAIPPTSLCPLPEAVVRIDTPEGVSSWRRQYDLPIAYRDMVRETIREREQNGTIVRAPVDTTFNTPIMLAPKKDSAGNYTKRRPCLDIRHINKLLLKEDKFPLPLIRDIFHRLEGAKCYSLIDVRAAFHRLPILKEHRHKTSFTVDGIQWMFRATPFGLVSTCSKYQRCMSILFKDMPYCFQFVDDIIVASNGLEEHSKHVAAVIQQLTKYAFIINTEKSVFANSCAYILGFCVISQGVTLDKRKVTNVGQVARPKTGKCIQRFLGMINYFREHLPKLSQLTAPLDRLRNEGLLDKLWTTEHEQTFNNLKQLVTSAPILHFPSTQHPYCVGTDASQTGIAAVLYQVIGEETRHIGFMARALTPSERRYGAVKRELLGIHYALEKFHKFLFGSHFTLYCDSRALSFMHRQKVANPMMINWYETIFSYDFTIVHLPGLSNILPDRLSCLFPSEKELAGDKALQSGKSKILYNRRMYTPTELQEMIVPPEEERHKLLQETHTFGHFGAEAIAAKLHTQGIHWPSINKEAVEIVRKCRECQKYNIVRQGFHPLRPVHSYWPSDQWALDLAGPFETSHRNNNYLLVCVDVCTRFCVLKAIPDKAQETIVTSLIEIWGHYGWPQYIQSDNGKEFINGLVKKLQKASGFEHRTSTVLHPRGNGVAERWVQTSVNLIRKSIKGATRDWDLVVPMTQLALNNKIMQRHGSTPFALMFARTMNSFSNYADEIPPEPLPHKELIERIETMQSVVFPAIAERTKAREALKKGKFDKKYK